VTQVTKASARARTEIGTRIGGVLTTRGRAFLAAGLTLLVGGLLLGFADISRVGVLLSALPLLAAFRARYAGRNSSSVVVTRAVYPAQLVVDQSARVTVLLRNTSDRHIQTQLAEERVPYLLGDQPRFVLPAMEPGDIREVSYEIRSQVRGRYQLGSLTLHRRDPYGLATVSTSLPSSTNILVLPRIEVLGHEHPRAKGIGAEGAIRHMVAQHGEDDVAVRTYREGDDLRRIHWPATAHRSELMVRQEDHPARRRAIIVLDSRTEGHRGSGTTGSFEWAVRAAASIAAHLSARRYTLQLASHETAADGLVAQALESDDALACLAIAQLGGSQQFDEVLRHAHPATSTAGLVIAIVTDHDEVVLRQVATLRRPEGTGLLILLDTASFDQPRPSAPADQTSAMAGMLAAAGWSTCVVSSDMTVAKAWDIISTRSAVTVGSGR
jgi:uncharacterized protein (DUF58 family)